RARHGCCLRGRRLDDGDGRRRGTGRRQAGGDPGQCQRAACLSRRARLMPTAAASRPLLEARGLDTYYGQSHVLRDLPRTIAGGETIGLMGRNGMGKTTLVRTLVGLIHPRRGQVLLDGEDVTAVPTHLIARRGVAYVPEGRGIFASLSVAENLMIAGSAAAGGRQRWSLAGVPR